MRSGVSEAEWTAATTAVAHFRRVSTGMSGRSLRGMAAGWAAEAEEELGRFGRRISQAAAWDGMTGGIGLDDEKVVGLLGVGLKWCSGQPDSRARRGEWVC